MRQIIAKSSNIQAIDYNEDEQTLDVEFKGGAVYRYLDVPNDIPHLMLAAASAGKFFMQNIKPNYEFEKLK